MEKDLIQNDLDYTETYLKKEIYTGIEPVGDVEEDMINASRNASSDETNNNNNNNSKGHKTKNCLSAVVHGVVPRGGIVANCFSLASVTLGGGIISMANSFRTSGILMAIIYLVVMCAITVYTMTLIGLAIRKSNLNSFETMGRGLFGRGGDYLVGAVIAISCTGTAIAYVNASGTLMKPILEQAKGTPAFLKTTNGNRCIRAAIWAVILLPAIVPKHLNSIRYISVLGVCFVLYFVLTIVIHSCQNGLRLGMRDDMVLFTTGNQAIFGLSIFIFAFMCQGITYVVYNEMTPKKSVRQLTVASGIAMSVCTLFYIIAGVFGYLDFSNAIKPSILENYDPIADPYIMVAYVGMLIKIVAAFCANWIPIRNFLYYCLRWNLETTPYWLHFIFCLIVSGIILVGGLFIPSVSTAFGLVGSICGGFISFIFPALFFMYCGDWSLKSVGIWHWLGCHILLLGGVIAIVWGTIATIYSSFIVTS